MVVEFMYLYVKAEFIVLLFTPFNLGQQSKILKLTSKLAYYASVRQLKVLAEHAKPKVYKLLPATTDALGRF